MDHNSSPGVELETEVDQLIFDWSELDDQSNTAYTNSGMRTLHSNESNPSSGPAGLTTFASTGSNSCSASSALMKKLHSRSSTSSSMGGWEDEGNLSGSASSYTPSSAIAAAAVMKRMHASCSRTSTGSDLWADVHEEYGTSVLMRKLGSDSSTGSVPVPGIGSGLGLGSTGQMGTATGKQISPGAMLLQNNGHSGGSSTAASSRCGSALGMSAHGHSTGIPSGPHRGGAHTHNSSMRSIITDISEDMAVMSVSGINSSSRDVDDRDTEGFGDIILSKSGSRPASPFADLGIGPGGSSSGGGSNSNSNSSRSRTTLGLISKQIQINNDYDPDHCQDSEYDGYVSPRLTKSALSQASSSFTPKANAGYKSESCFNFNIPRTSLNREHSLSLLPHPVPGISGGSVGVGLRSAGVDDQLVALSDGEGLLTSGPICGITDNIFVDGFEQVYDPNPDDSDHSNDLGGGNGEEQDAEDDDDEDDEGLPDSTSAIGSNNSSRASTCNSVSGLARENVFYFKTGGVAPLVLSPTAAASRNGRNRDNSFESAGTLVADQNDDRNSTLGLNLGGLHPGHSLGITIPLELMAAPTDAPGSAISHNSASDKRGNSLFRMKNVEPGVKTAPVSRRKRRKLITIPDESVINADGTPGTRTIVAPKGIYKTPHGYRVQLNIEHKSKKQTKKPRAGTAAATAAAAEKDRQTTASEFDPLGALRSKISASLTSEMASSSTNTGKFSRNSKSFEDAVWLYEVAILLSDDIRSTSELIGRGNYESMEAMRWIDNEQAYLDSFAANILKLGNSKLLTPIEHAIATATFERITNHHKDSVSPRGSPRGSPRSTAGARGASTGTHLDIKLSSGGVPPANAGGTSISPGGSALSVPTAAVM